MSNEYQNVTTLEQHQSYVAMRKAARALLEALSAGELRKMSLAELEQLINELEQLVTQKQARERVYSQMTGEELGALMSAVEDELRARRAALVAKAEAEKPKPKPIGPTSAPQPTMSKVSKAKEAAPPSGAALAAALEQIAEAVRRGH